METTLRTPSTIRLDVTPVDSGTQDRAWNLKVTVKDKDEQAVAGLPIRSRGQKLEHEPASEGERLATDSSGTAEGRLYLMPPEPPESQTHGPGIRYLEAAAGDGAVTLSFKVFDWEKQPLEGVAVEIVAAGQMEPLRVETTATGEARGTLQLG